MFFLITVGFFLDPKDQKTGALDQARDHLHVRYRNMHYLIKKAGYTIGYHLYNLLLAGYIQFTLRVFSTFFKDQLSVWYTCTYTSGMH